MAGVKAIGKELRGALPLFDVHVETMNVDCNNIVSFYSKPSNLGVFGKSVSSGRIGNIVFPERLMEYLSHEVHITELIVSEIFFESSFIASSFLNKWIKLSS